MRVAGKKKVKPEPMETDEINIEPLEVDDVEESEVIKSEVDSDRMSQGASSAQASKRLNKEGRLIVRNLPYKITLEKLKEHFSQCGELTDTVILKKPDGKLVGCGFVQFSSKECAANAVSTLNRKPLLGRPIIVDWAVPKNQYLQIIGNASDIKTETDETLNVSIKPEESAIYTDGNSGEGNEEPYELSGSENESDTDVEESGEESASDDEEETFQSTKDKTLSKKHPIKSDVSEGCTVFVKNLSFSSDNEALRDLMKEFGQICYAVVCIDPLTEHSKGTGFVKFKSKASAEACLAAGSEKKITSEGRVLEVHPALSRDDVKVPHSKEKDPKDKRNLYLAKEGLILASSPAASGLSSSDMEKRLSLEEKKRRLLKNLHYFISRTRLSVYNIPPTYNDMQLRSLFLKFGGSNSVITEARIMRNLRDVDANGLGKSKGFGFVTFTDHENALQALRNLNNNPKIFSPAKRPIVMFSIENRSKLNLKEKRLEKSRRNNNRKSASTFQKDWEKNRKLHRFDGGNGLNKSRPLNNMEKKKMNVDCANERQSVEPGQNSIPRKERRKLRKLKFKEERRQKLLKRKGLQITTVGSDATSESYQGVVACPGQTSVLSKRKLDEQAHIHQQTLKEKRKMNRRKRLLTSERIKLPKQKMSKAKDQLRDDNFSKLVSQYREQLGSSVQDSKKWYDS